MNDLSNIFLWFSYALVLLWTVRLARSKGKNPFLWGGIAFLLMLIPSWPGLLSMGPLAVLLFMKAPQKPAEEPVQEAITCPKCRAYHALGHTYCVNCGWELNRPYSEPSGQPAETNAPSPVQLEQRVESAAPPETVDQAAADSEAVSAAADSGFGPEPASTETEGETEAEAPEPVPTKPKETRPVTAARFTEQGLEFLGQDRVQEAIDQFTKAIALDAAYIPAWEHRAEAYVRQGRKDKAEEDRQQLKALQ